MMKIKVTIADQTFEVEVGDLQARPIMATIDGETFAVTPESAAASPMAAPAASARPAPAAAPAAPRAPAAGGGGGKQVVAPIPGVIISITVKPGDVVKQGQELLILEAMKMKNAIRANRAGTIATILVAAGDQVRHSQPLIEFTD